MSRTFRALSAVFLLAFASPALAKDFCFGIGGDVTSAFVLQNVHVPRPGKTAPITGAFIYVDSMSRFRGPISGTIYHDSQDQKLMIGVFVHGMLHGQPAYNSTTMTWEANPATLEGTAAIDEDGDFREDESLVLTSVSCKSLTFP
ncbi:MAG TPA: hypothetical protein VMR86_16350 [Myxococcota bacterium]|nr:hypothetical protein [Myxococcota bacterium]